MRWLLLFPLMLLAGCAMPDPKTGLQTSASYVGDRATVSFGEVIVAVQVDADLESYHNLHVELAAIINPRETSIFEPHKVEALMRRLEPRISAELVDLLLGSEINIRQLRDVKARVQDSARAVVTPIVDQWAHASEYDIQIVVVALYLTDGSVGRAQARQRWW